MHAHAELKIVRTPDSPCRQASCTDCTTVPLAPKKPACKAFRHQNSAAPIRMAAL